MKTIGFDDFLETFENEKTIYRNMHIIRSHDKTNFTETIYKKVLDGRDEKREIQEDRIETLPWR